MFFCALGGLKETPYVFLCTLCGLKISYVELCSNEQLARHLQYYLRKPLPIAYLYVKKTNICHSPKKSDRLPIKKYRSINQHFDAIF